MGKSRLKRACEFHELSRVRSALKPVFGDSVYLDLGKHCISLTGLPQKRDVFSWVTRDLHGRYEEGYCRGQNSQFSVQRSKSPVQPTMIQITFQMGSPVSAMPSTQLQKQACP